MHATGLEWCPPTILCPLFICYVFLLRKFLLTLKIILGVCFDLASTARIVSSSNCIGKYWISDGSQTWMEERIRTGKEKTRYSVFDTAYREQQCDYQY